MKRRKLLFVVFVLLMSCGYIPSSLTEEDVDQYIEAYQNLAEVSPNLATLQAKTGSISIFTCSACKEVMENAVVDAGYSSLESFMIMDLRMSYTMRYVLYLELTQLVSEAGEDIPIENLCAQGNQSSLSTEDKKTFDEYCEKAVLYTTYIEKMSKFVNNLVEYLISKADFDVVASNFDELHDAITNPSLISELNRSGGGDWDD